MRIGIFTGKIYSDEDFKNNKINECVMIFDSDSEEDAKKRRLIRKLMYCSDCTNCKESSKAFASETRS